MIRSAVAVLVVIVALLGAVACGDSDNEAQTTSQTQTAANQAVCADVEAVQDAASNITSLDPANTTLSELQSNIGDLTSSLAALRASASSAATADKAALSSAVDGLRSAVQDFGDGASLSQDLTAVAAALVPVEQALDDIGANCPDSQ